MFSIFRGCSGSDAMGRRCIHKPAVSLAAGTLLLSVLGSLPARGQGVPWLPDPRSMRNENFGGAAGLATGMAQRINRPDVLDLEPAVVQAELILAVRLVDVTETKIVYGGRNVQITEQYRFEPVRVLKGIFARESLLLTGQDLGIYRFAESSDRLSRGQLMLVLLGRQDRGYVNCNEGATLAQSIPRLAGMDDPLLAAVDVLIAMTRKRDRAARVALVRDGLKGATGRAAPPLLLSLARRALLAAQDPGVMAAILPYLKTGTPSHREVAARTLGAMFEADRRTQGGARTEVVKALVAALESGGPDDAARVALIDALSLAGATAGREGGALTWLKAGPPAATLAESAARLRALDRLGAVEEKEQVARIYAAMPLDLLSEAQHAAGMALARLNAKAAAGVISSRLANKRAAGLGIALEIALLAELPAAIATPELQKAWGKTLEPEESLAFAYACFRVADPRLVSLVSTLLDPRQWQVRAFAVDALLKIDNDEAASALWPHLDEEPTLPRKLEVIAFLGRHGFRDGYAQAIEHLSQPALSDLAVEALGAIGEPRAIPELRRIWQTSNDLSWNSAAIRALARMGQADIAPNLLALARVPGEPLAPAAILGLGDLGSAEALPLVRDALASRSDTLVIAASRAAAKLLARPRLKSDPIRDRLAALLADADAAQPVRQAAMEALVALGDPRLVPALAAVARDANLEGTPFLAQVERTLSTRGAAVNPKSE
jgi:HEAT repeat protein